MLQYVVRLLSILCLLTYPITSHNQEKWKPTSTEKSADARVLHTGVWTGNQMIVWGGINDHSGVLNTGGKYDPSTDIWKPVTMEDAPTPRVFHTAIWDGHQMIIWGGSNNEGVSNTGSKFSK